MIIFESVSYKNFLSAGNAETTILLNKSPTTIITGENGAGKSTLLDAISFALFNKPYRNINKPQLVNSINGKHCEVTIRFVIGNKSYVVRRGLKPAIFEIECDGNLLPQPADARDYQNWFEEHILKINYKTFMQIAVMGSAQYVPFMQLPTAQRREIIEDLLDIKIFSVMNQLLKDRLATIKDSIKTTDGDILVAKKKVEIQQKLIRTLADDRSAKKETLVADIDERTKENAEHNAKLDAEFFVREQLSAKQPSYSTLDAKKKKYTTLQTKLDSKVNKLHKEIAFYQENDSCPTCKQNIDTELKNDQISELKKLEAEIEVAKLQMNATYEELEFQLEVFEELERDIKAVDKNITAIRQDIKTNEAIIARATKELVGLEANTSNIDTEKDVLKEYANEVVELMKRKSTLNEQKHDLEVSGILLKDTGIKTKIIQQYLPIINKMINSYLNELDLFVNFEFDEAFNETIKSRNRDSFSYASFSEGEKARINFSILMCFREIAKMKNSLNTNLLILDELVDSSLDGIGLEVFMGMLNDISSNGINVMVVSHRENITDRFRSHIKMQKRNGYSVIAKTA